MFIITRRLLLGVTGAGLVLPSLVASRAWAQDAAKPATPTTPMPSIKTFAQTPTVDQIALSPDGKRIAAITQKDDEKFLLFFDLAGGDP
jgi:hypothetical protein